MAFLLEKRVANQLAIKNIQKLATHSFRKKPMKSIRSMEHVLNQTIMEELFGKSPEINHV
jgi:hypothetical protein